MMAGEIQAGEVVLPLPVTDSHLTVGSRSWVLSGRLHQVDLVSVPVGPFAGLDRAPCTLGGTMPSHNDTGLTSSLELMTAGDELDGLRRPERALQPVFDITAAVAGSDARR